MGSVWLAVPQVKVSGISQLGWTSQSSKGSTACCATVSPIFASFRGLFSSWSISSFGGILNGDLEGRVVERELGIEESHGVYSFL